MPARRAALAAALAATVSMVASCGSAVPYANTTGATVAGRVTIFAATSLTDALNDVGRAFHSRYPGANAQFNFAGSQTLAAQITQGAAADLFASADQVNMQKVVDRGDNDGQPRDFTANRLAIVVQAGNPRGISSLADLARPGTVVVLCALAAPCGAYTQQSLAAAGVRVSPRSEEQDVRSVLTRVSLKEADAGIVYTTDVAAGGSAIQGVDIPPAHNVLARYPAVAIRSGPNRAAARAFIDLLLSSEGQAILARYGFTAP